MSYLGKLSAVLAALALCLALSGIATAAAPAGAKPMLKSTAQDALKVIKPININTASAQELTLLNGVGPVLAQKIVDYRKKNGAFKKPEDIKNVSGIGDKIFQKNKKFIKVK